MSAANVVDVGEGFFGRVYIGTNGMVAKMPKNDVATSELVRETEMGAKLLGLPNVVPLTLKTVTGAYPDGSTVEFKWGKGRAVANESNDGVAPELTEVMLA